MHIFFCMYIMSYCPGPAEYICIYGERCMYVCMYVCIYIYMYTHIYIHNMYVYKHIYMYKKGKG